MGKPRRLDFRGDGGQDRADSAWLAWRREAEAREPVPTFRAYVPSRNDPADPYLWHLRPVAGWETPCGREAAPLFLVDDPTRATCVACRDVSGAGAARARLHLLDTAMGPRLAPNGAGEEEDGP